MKPAKSTLWARSTPAISSLILPPEIVSMSHTADTGVLTLSRAREHLVQVTQSSMPAHVSQPSELWGARCATQCCDPPRLGAARFSSLSASGSGTGPGPGATPGLSPLSWVTPLCVAPPAWQGPCGHHWPGDPMWQGDTPLATSTRPMLRTETLRHVATTVLLLWNGNKSVHTERLGLRGGVRPGRAFYHFARIWRVI